MYRVWYSTESFADYIIDNTNLKNYKVEKYHLLESDARDDDFHALPDHIKQILKLDCPDLIIERKLSTYSEPILSIEVTTEAGTGHNVFQRFGRIVSAVEHGIPSFYIYPKAKIITRKKTGTIKWDKINPLIFHALEVLMRTYNIPALFYFFPSDYDAEKDPLKSNYLKDQGLKCSTNIAKYAGCPDETDAEMQNMFLAINTLISKVECSTPREACQQILIDPVYSDRRTLMLQTFFDLSKRKKDKTKQSPNTSTITIPTEYLINYLKSHNYVESQYESLLKQREETVIYTLGAKDFRADPYTGCLTAIDFMQCRAGSRYTFEERNKNLVVAFGKVIIDDGNKIIDIKGSMSVERFCKDVRSSEKRNLLKSKYSELKEGQVPRYYMQVRYGSMFSKNKAVRMFSYYADAILFKDGALWREN